MAEQFMRLPHGGRVDRDNPRRFRFDGDEFQGLAGDTLASALLANGVHLTGRSFKLHRPRGIVSAGVEEPNALLTLRSHSRTEPNIPATMAELCDGLQAKSQNRWPRLAFDALAINDLASRFLPAGFYYKTFMGPTRGAWMYYEPWIRRAAGLGKPTHTADPDRYEREHAFCDVLVVGCGAAGLAAALAAARAGRRVFVLEQHAVAGGQLLSEPADSNAEQWRRACLDELTAQPNVTLLLRTTAFGLYDGGVVGAVERVSDHLPVPPADTPRQRTWNLHAERIVLATGATERPLLFGNNDRPGIMLAEAARRYLNHFAVLPGRRIVVQTNNDSAYAAAAELAAAGANVHVADTRANLDDTVIQPAAAAGATIAPASRIDSAQGYLRVEGVTLHGPDGRHKRRCDLVCVAGGWSPNVHLAAQRGERPTYRCDLGAFVPAGLPDDIATAGAVAGTLATADAVAEGWRVGGEAAGTDAGEAIAAPTTAAAPGYLAANNTDVGEPRPQQGKVFVDWQNDVSVKDVELAWREGYRSVEHLKRYTTLGMGTDQGRTSNINALKLMASLRGQDIPTTGTTTFRPPFTPVALGALAGRRAGPHFRAQRCTPMYDLHCERDAAFVTAGAWLRPWYYRTHGHDVDTAYIHEMRAVRENVGMVDASTLGKIDVQGPDAAAFLDRVYVNGWRKLPVGRCRYGAMLRDDGFVLDDGTTSRLGENHYFMTTTTGEAAVVMSWLEYLLETAWPELRVHVTSVTDQWAAIAVAGPNSKRVLEAALSGVDLDDGELPPMGVRDDVCGDGLPVRLLRVSFSGERAYEVYTPAGYGDALWRRIEAAGADFGITAYGLEALGGLRIEKGHPIASEIDGRTTLEDIGLGAMDRGHKRFVGDVLRHRPALAAADRRRLVGLKPIDPRQPLRAGGLVFPNSARVEGHGIGHITSVTWSVELQTHVALALVEGGREREGDIVDAVSPVHDERLQVEIVSPVFIDPEGSRLHA